MAHIHPCDFTVRASIELAGSSIEKTQYSSQEVKDNAIIDLVQGVAHMHLKQAEGLDMPECIEDQAKSWTLVLPVVVTSFWPLGMLTTISTKFTTRRPAPGIPAAAACTVFLTLAVDFYQNLASGSGGKGFWWESSASISVSLSATCRVNLSRNYPLQTWLSAPSGPDDDLALACSASHYYVWVLSMEIIITYYDL